MLTRSEIKSKLAGGLSSLNTAIEAAPVPAFLGGIALGALLVLFASYLYTLSVVLGIGLAGMWLFAEEEPKKSERASTSVRQAPDQAS